MPTEIKRMTMVAYDDNTVEVVDEHGFPFPPTLIVTFDDFNGAAIFNAGPWDLEEVMHALAHLAMGMRNGHGQHYEPETTE